MRLIDADALKESMRGEFIDHIEEHRAITIIGDAPTIEPKRGKWMHYEGELTCSNCGATYYDDIMGYMGDYVPHFCPDCGAEMRGKNDD